MASNTKTIVWQTDGADDTNAREREHSHLLLNNNAKK